MFNSHEHILHLYECIDELRDEIHLIRMRQNMDAVNDINTHVPNFYNPDILGNTLSYRDIPRQNTTSTGLNWSVQRENRRNYMGLPNRRPSSTRSNSSNNSNNSNSSNSNRNTTSSRRNIRIGNAGNASNADNTGNSGNASNSVNRTSRTTRLTPPSNPTVTNSSPNSIEFTFYEPRISSVRERLDTLLDSLRRDYNLPPINNTNASVSVETNLNPILGESLGLGLDTTLGDDNERRLTLAEINTGCETKIHSGEDETCSICREVINGTSIVREIKNCRHKFHQLCLDTWLENRRTCPICRGEVCLSANTAVQRATETATATATAAATNSVVEDLD